MSINNKVNINLVLLGSYESGKSSIVERWKHPSVTPHPDETVAIEVNSNTIKMNNMLYIVRTWDTSGRDMYESLLSRYIYNADCCVIVYDVTDIKTWEKAKKWVEVIKADHGPKLNICLLGNKIDRESIRRIHKVDVQHYVNGCGMYNVLYSECSARTGENCFETYQMILDYTKRPVARSWVNRIDKDNPSKCLVV